MGPHAVNAMETRISSSSSQSRVAFKWGALLIAIAVGMMIDLALIVITGVLIPAVFSAAGIGIDALGPNLPWVSRNLCGSPAMILIGALYCFLHSRDRSFNALSGAVGGAAAGALTGLASRLAEACVLVTTLSFQAAGGLALLPSDVPVEAGGAVLAVALGLYTCLGVGAGAVLGLAGGGIGALIFRRRTAR